MTCPMCGGTGHARSAETLEQRIDRTEARLLAACEAGGLVLTGDLRISAKDAAAFLGLSVEGLKQAKSEGRAPTAYALGVGGKTRSSYRLRDIASWIEQRYDTP
jgi:hypothetical protein